MDEEAVSLVVSFIVMLAVTVGLGFVVFVLVAELGDIGVPECASEVTHEQVEDYGDYEVVTVTTYCLDGDGRIKGQDTEEYYREAS